MRMTIPYIMLRKGGGEGRILEALVPCLSPIDYTASSAKGQDAKMD